MQTSEQAELRAVPQDRCFVCGPRNPNGLRIRYTVAAQGTVSAIWIPTEACEGLSGIIHGGIVAAVLDEAMAKAVVAAGIEALTGELRVRYRERVVPGETLRIQGWVVRRTKRLVATEAVLSGPEVGERAHAWASFLTLRHAGEFQEDHVENRSADE